MSRYWGLVITYCDVENNQFLELGGAAWNTKRERDANWKRIPTAKNETNYILDVKSDRGIDADQFVDADTVERLIGKPVKSLIAEAREHAERRLPDPPAQSEVRP